MDKLIRDSETQLKLDAINQARREFVALYTRKEEMLICERNSIYLKYVKQLGVLQFENFKLGVDVRALKLKIELAQEALARHERPDMDAINHQTRQQLADYYTEVANQSRALREAREIHELSCEDIAELRDLYRLMVKKLHPELHPAQSDRDYDLFLKGQSAYRSMNLEALRQVIVLLDVTIDDDHNQSKGETLDHTLWRLRSQIALFTTAISELSRTFPFDQVELLANARLLRERQDKLRAEQADILHERDLLADRLTLFN